MPVSAHERLSLLRHAPWTIVGAPGARGLRRFAERDGPGPGAVCALRLRLLLTLTALLGALVIPIQAHGNASSGPRAFWKAYPLQPSSRATVGPSARSRTAARPVAMLAKSSGMSGFPVLAALVAAEALALAALVGRRRLRRSSAAAASLTFPRRAWPPGTEQQWRAEVVWAGGYRKGRFRAVAIPPSARRGRPIAATKMVDVTRRRAPDPVRPQFRAPFDHLVADLRRAGWQPVEPGSRWWSVRFVWTRSSRP
jgi:hypothetical protein